MSLGDFFTKGMPQTPTPTPQEAAIGMYKDAV